MKDIIAFVNNKEFSKAIKGLQKKLKKDKKNKELYYYLGWIYQLTEDFKNSKLYYKKAIALNYKTIEIYQNLAYVCEKIGDLDDLKRSWIEINKIRPSWELYANLAKVLQDEGKYEEALSYFHLAIQLNPNNWLLYYNMGNVYRKDNEYNKAEINYNKAIELEPNNPNSYLKLGHIQHNMNKYDEAIISYKKAITLHPKFIQAYHSLSLIYTHIKEYEMAISVYDKVIKLDPLNNSLYFEKGLIYLKLERFKDAWSFYDYRYYKVNKSDRKEIKFHEELDKNIPVYSGQDIKGKTLYVYSEQGLGDAIMFAPLLKRFLKDTTIIFKVEEPLFKLFKNSLESENIKIYRDIPDKKIKLDYQTRLLNILYNFILEKGDGLLSPYINLSDNISNKFNFFNKNTFKVGFSFKGNPIYVDDNNRSLTLEFFLKFFDDYKNISYYSLQKDVSKDDRKLLNEYGIKSLGEQFGDFYDTSAAINHLDLVISVDTSVAHLSAAKNKPTWILLPYNADWRWGINSDKSYWYGEHVSLFRQNKINNWDETIIKVKKSLKSLVINIKEELV